MTAELLCVVFVACALCGAFGYQLRGWYDRRMRPWEGVKVERVDNVYYLPGRKGRDGRRA